MKPLVRGLLIAFVVSLIISIVMIAAVSSRSRDRTNAGAIDTTLPELFTIGEFQFTNQLGRPVGREMFEDRVTVASIFFGNCVSICPGVISQLQRLTAAVPGVRLVVGTQKFQTSRAGCSSAPRIRRPSSSSADRN
ncbi:MAG TPA: SCO family protein [Tepidisphaeraceae bacterium]|nr:SCO family protein [Tepidisphaeraceae bacterium]